MRRKRKDEYGFEPQTESTYLNRDEYSYADEYRETGSKDNVISDQKDTSVEFNASTVIIQKNEKDSKRRILKRSMFALISMAAAALSIVFAAGGLDPLGADFLVTGSLTAVTPASPTTPVTPTVPATPTSPTTPATPAAYTDSFPTLPNLDPDFAGAYAWAGMGSEEYINVDKKYLHAGTLYTSSGTSIETLYGASYDKTTNTLTLNNYNGSVIDVNLMGNGFKIELIGNNALDNIRIWGAMYGGSVTFTGSGSLKINEKLNYKTGLMLECEDSQSCIMIDREATVEVFGQYAIIVHRTTLEKAIYALEPVKMSGGTYSTGQFVEYNVNVTDENGIPLTDENGEYITEIKTVKDIAESQGIDLYDYSIVDADGKPSSHVIFKPE